MRKKRKGKEKNTIKMTTVTLRIFSGIHNPKWTFACEQQQEYVNKLSLIREQGELVKTQNVQSGIGYHGFVISTGIHSAEVYNGVLRDYGKERRFYEDRGRELEKWIYSTIPSGIISEKVHEEIKGKLLKEK